MQEILENKAVFRYLQRLVKRDVIKAQDIIVYGHAGARWPPRRIMLIFFPFHSD